MNIVLFALAGVPFRTEAAFDTTREFCRDYLTEEASLFPVSLTPANIDTVKIFSLLKTTEQ